MHITKNEIENEPECIYLMKKTKIKCKSLKLKRLQDT